MADSVLCKDVKPDWKISSLLPCPKETITPDTHEITVLIPTRSPRENCKLRESTYMLRGCLNGLLNKRRNFLHVDTFADSETQLEEKKNKHLEEENQVLKKENMEVENIKSHYAQLEENKKPKQLEHKYEIMERKMHLKVAELKEKLKDAHLITEIENDYKQYQLNKHMEAKQQPQEKCQEFELKNQRLQNRNAELVRVS